MEFLTQLERTVLGWLKSVPHLPVNAQKWLATNVWWIALIGAILTGITVLWLVVSVFSNLSALTSPIISYYASTTFVTLVIIKSLVALVFAALEGVLLAIAVAPLKAKQKKGWVLLFAVLLVSAVSALVSAVLTFNPFSFITNIIFSALWIAVGAYFVFEIHGQFAHVERSKGVKAKVPPRPTTK